MNLRSLGVASAGEVLGGREAVAERVLHQQLAENRATETELRGLIHQLAQLEKTQRRRHEAQKKRLAEIKQQAAINGNHDNQGAPSMNPLTNLPAPVRQTIYTALALVVLVEGALAVAFTTQPGWLLTATRVTAYVSGVVGLTAAANVSRKRTRKTSTPSS